MALELRPCIAGLARKSHQAIGSGYVGVLDWGHPLTEGPYVPAAAACAHYEGQRMGNVTSSVFHASGDAGDEVLDSGGYVCLSSPLAEPLTRGVVELRREVDEDFAQEARRILLSAKAYMCGLPMVDDVVRHLIP